MRTTRTIRVLAGLAAAAVLTGTATASAQSARTTRPTATQDLLVRTAPGAAPQVAGQLPAGATALAVNPAVDVLVVRATSAAASALRNRPLVLGATADGPVRLASDSVATAPAGYQAAADPHSLLSTTQVIGARAAWPASRAGAGVDVAVIDTGVAAVDGLADTGRVAPGVDLSIDQGTDGADTDGFGHGTHMAGIIAGRDAGADPADDAGSSDRFLGVAPSARVVPVRVADRYGSTDVSQVIAGLDWVIRNAHTDGRNIRVVNLSFGTDSLQGYQLDPLAYAAERAWQAGLVVVTSAGNGGRVGLSDPAYDPFLLAVGAAETSGTATTADDTVLAFSNRGDGRRGPDLVAPGRSQQSLRVPGSRIDTSYGSTGRLGERFFRGTGTSQAAAVVSGAAALVLANRPALTPDQVKRLLVSTARKLPNATTDAQGAGLVDVGAAVAAATPDSNEAAQRWPRAVGTGSLQAARGTAGALVGRVNGSIGDHGVESFAQTDDAASVAAAPAAAARSLRSGVTVRSWNGNAWDGNAWDGNAWDGNAWDGNAWDGNAWDGNAWDGLGWD